MTEAVMPWRWVVLAVVPCILLGFVGWALDHPLSSIGACCLSATWAIGTHERWEAHDER